jgi:hypothetical protein
MDANRKGGSSSKQARQTTTTTTTTTVEKCKKKKKKKCKLSEVLVLSHDIMAFLTDCAVRPDSMIDCRAKQPTTTTTPVLSAHSFSLCHLVCKRRGNWHHPQPCLPLPTLLFVPHERLVRPRPPPGRSIACMLPASSSPHTKVVSPGCSHPAVF